MMKVRFFSGLAGVVVALALVGAPSMADEKHVLVVQEDANLDSLPRGSGASVGAAAIIAEALSARGMTAALGADALGDLAGVVRITSTQLLDGARALDPVPDVAVIFTLYASAQSSMASDGQMQLELATRITGRAVALGTLDVLAAHDTTRPPKALAKDCGRDCVLGEVAEEAALVAGEFGRVLADALSAP